MALAMGITICYLSSSAVILQLLPKRLLLKKALESWKLFSLVQKRKPIFMAN